MESQKTQNLEGLMAVMMFATLIAIILLNGFVFIDANSGIKPDMFVIYRLSLFFMAAVYYFWLIVATIKTLRGQIKDSFLGQLVLWGALYSFFISLYNYGESFVSWNYLSYAVLSAFGAVCVLGVIQKISYLKNRKLKAR